MTEKEFTDIVTWALENRIRTLEQRNGRVSEVITNDAPARYIVESNEAEIEKLRTIQGML